VYPRSRRFPLQPPVSSLATSLSEASWDCVPDVTCPSRFLSSTCQIRNRRLQRPSHPARINEQICMSMTDGAVFPCGVFPAGFAASEEDTPHDFGQVGNNHRRVLLPLAIPITITITRGQRRRTSMNSKERNLSPHHFRQRKEAYEGALPGRPRKAVLGMASRQAARTQLSRPFHATPRTRPALGFKVEITKRV